MGSSSSASLWSVGVPSVPAATPAWPSVAFGALHPVADSAPCPAAGVLPGVAPVLDNTPRPAAGVLPPVGPVLDDTLPPAADVLPGIERSVP